MAIKQRDDLRNVAIVAHVDHGKTTLVDAMLWQSGAFTAHQADTGDVNERVMDSNDLEREKGITILAKNTAVDHVMPNGERLTINIIDTPGPRRLRRRGRARRCRWSTACCCSSTPPRGRCRRPGSSCARRSRPGCRSILVINKVDRPGRADRRGRRRDLRAVPRPRRRRAPDRVPDRVRVGQGRPGVAEAARRRRRCRTSENLQPLFETILEPIPAPTYDDDAPLQAHVTNLDASPYLGRLALCRVHNGTIRKGQQVAWCRADGTIERVKITELLITRGARPGARPSRPARATSSPSPASPRSPSARRWPTPTIRGRCR